MGSRMLHRRINNVKLDLEHARRRLKEVREQEFEMSKDDEVVLQRVGYAKELIDDLGIRLTTSEEGSGALVIDQKPLTAPAVIY